jgi:broad specificity phosphatase PhoE
MRAAPLHFGNGTELASFVHARGPHCLIVTRHGETGWNAEGRLQGQQDTSLSNRGRSQAQRAAVFLRNLPLKQVHSSTLQRSRETANSIVAANISNPIVTPSDLLKETALGVLEGELKDHQSTVELSRHYRKFCEDEIHYRVPGGENLCDVAARVQRFFDDHAELVTGEEIHLIVGHRNLNKMILKHLLGLSFEEGFRVEQEHQRLYLYFDSSKELWSCWIDAGGAALGQGYATTMGDSYA